MKHYYLLLFLICLFIIIVRYDDKLNKTFYTIKETYPMLNDIDYKLVLNDLKNVININWQEWPEYNLWKNKKNDKIKWTIFPIKAFEKWSEQNIKLCPYIYNKLKNDDNIVNIGFSRLSPNTVLDQHQGWANLSNYVLRCHLALIVSGPAYIYCENDKRQQIIGKWIIFDDSKNHYADNFGNEDRIVLILDIKRPNNVKLGISEIEDSTELIGFIKEFQK